jgi:NADH:ubiquinone oxidoreductase subunit E
MSTRPIGAEIEAWIQQQWSRFPPGAAGKALTLSVLYMMQERYGSVDADIYDSVAQRLGVTPSHVKGVATFYTMLNKKPVGRYHLQVCTNIGCMLEGAYDVFDHCKRRLGVGHRGTTSDDNVTLSEVECLAACGFGPVAQIAERARPEIPLYFENLDTTKIDQILDALAEGRVPTELGR